MTKDSKSIRAIKKEYMKLCEETERSRVLNPNQVNQDCGGLVHLVDTDRRTINDLKWFIKWHRKALREGEHDWEMLDIRNRMRRERQEKSHKRPPVQSEFIY